MVQISQELGREYWATRLSVHSFFCTVHSFACSALLFALTRSAALRCAPLRSFVRSLAHFAHSQARGRVGILMSQNHTVLNHSALPLTFKRHQSHFIPHPPLIQWWSFLMTIASYIQITAHYGTKPGHFKTSIIHFPTSEGVSKVSE